MKLAVVTGLSCVCGLLSAGCVDAPDARPALTTAQSDGGSSGGETTDDSESDPPGDDTMPASTSGATSGDPSDDPSGSDTENVGDHEAIDDYIIGLGTIETPPNELDEGEPSAEAPSGDYMCSTTDLSQTQQFDQLVAFAANSGVLFPGALIDGASISDGTLTPRVFDRAPLTFSASLEGVIDGAVSATLEQPTLSAFREAMSDLLDANIVGNTAANIAYEMSEVHSSEQLSLALGLDVGWMTGDVAGSLEFGQEDRKSRFLVSFTQAYYTVDIDAPGRPSDLLDDATRLEDVQDVLADVPPAYVSSVTYGRVVYFAVTSNFSAQELRSALDFGFSSGAADVAGNVSLTHTEILEESQITAFILGGDGDVAVQAIQGADGIGAFLNSGGTYSPDSPGAAISYKLAYLADNSPARFSLTTDYQVQQCTRVSQNVRLVLQNLHVVNDGSDPGSELELFGFVDGWDEDGNIYPLMDRNLNEYVTVDMGQSWPQSGEIESQIIPVVPQAGHHFTIGVALRERDGVATPDDSFGDHWFQIDYEDGWRDDNFVAHLADGDQQVEVRMAFAPVP